MLSRTLISALPSSTCWGSRSSDLLPLGHNVMAGRRKTGSCSFICSFQSGEQKFSYRYLKWTSSYTSLARAAGT